MSTAPGYRLVIELGSSIRSYGVLAGSQIDSDPTTLSSQMKLWLSGQYRPRPFYDDEIARHQVSKQTISF